MKASVKKQWVEALRSGQFEQDRTFLHRISVDGAHQYCCLGVLCELQVPELAVVSGGSVSYGQQLHVMPFALRNRISVSGDTEEMTATGQSPP